MADSARKGTSPPVSVLSGIPGAADAKGEKAADIAASPTPTAITIADDPEVVARQQRRTIVHQAGIRELAEATAASMKPTNVVEEMLGDILAASYNGALRLIRRASTNGHVNEIAMLTRASGRMMSAFTEAALALHKLRSNGRQDIVVQHVQQIAVESGGQALVAMAGTGGLGRAGGEE